MTETHTVVIIHNTQPKKLTKIIPTADGSFSVAVPYHSATHGYLYQRTVDYSQKDQPVDRSQLLKEYQASNRAKLSVHHSGFVQFSSAHGNTIRSGIDPSSGKPRGLGYYSAPLTDPVLTGPTVAITAWGLEDYQDFSRGSKGTVVYTFTPDAIFYRLPGAQRAAYALEIIVFPAYMRNGIFGSHGAEFIRATFNLENTQATLLFRVVRLPGGGSFLGLLLARIPAKFPAPSGYILSGPGPLRPQSETVSEGMYAVYPNFIAPDAAASLDYIPPHVTNGRTEDEL
jgi:hypothetical protein